MAKLLLITVLLIKIVTAKIELELNVDNGVQIKYTGSEINTITDEDVKAFKIGNQYLITALDKFIGHRPRYIELRKDFDLYKLKSVRRILKIKSAKVVRSSKKPIVVMSQDFDNTSTHKMKANAGISHSVANTLTTSWDTEKEIEVSQEVHYALNLYFFNVDGTTGFTFSNKWGEGFEQSKTETIGTTSNVEVELEPGEAIRSVLSAYAGVLEIEVVHMAYLQGVISYEWEGHQWVMPLDSVMAAGGIKNEVTTTETIKFNYFVQSNLRVYDKQTGLMLL